MLRRSLIAIGLASAAVIGGVPSLLPATAAPAASVGSARAVPLSAPQRQACHRRARLRRRCHGSDRQGKLSGAVLAAPAPSPTSAAAFPGAVDVTPPKFAGLQTAFACTPGPQRPGQTTPFNLSWEAAVDDVTPSSEIVYDVYLATTQGGEDFATPTWTTPPGVTSFRTPGLPSHGSFYFVVRARDRAGNEDRNTVELLGSDPCL